MLVGDKLDVNYISVCGHDLTFPVVNNFDKRFSATWSTNSELTGSFVLLQKCFANADRNVEEFRYREL